MKRMRLLAHSGRAGGLPENTLEGMAAAARFGADGIECDVRLAADGEPVIFHDDDLRRMTGSEGRVDRLPYPDLSRRLVRGRHRIPRLEEVLDLVLARPGLDLYLDLHAPSFRLAESVSRAIARKGLFERCFVLGFYSESRDYLLWARSVCPLVRVSLMPEYPWSLLEKAQKVGAEDIAIGWDRRLHLKALFFGACRLVDIRSQLLRAKAGGVRASAGIANTPAEVRWCVEAGVDGIWTDELAMAQETLERLGLR